MRDIINLDKLEGRQISFPVLNPLEDFESWNFNINLNDDRIIKIQFSVNDNYNVPVKSSIHFQVIENGQSIINKLIQVESNDAFFDAEKCNIKIKDNWCINRGDFYEIYVKEDGVGAYLKLYPQFPEWANSEDGIVNKNLIGTRYVGWSYPITYADVTGIIIENNKESKIQGKGTLSHVWGNDQLVDKIENIIYGEFFVNDIIWFYHIASFKDKETVAKLVGISKDGVKFDLLNYFNKQDFDFEVKFDSLNNKIPKCIIFKDKELVFEININKNELIDSRNNNSKKINSANCVSYLSNIELKTGSKSYKTESINEIYLL